MRLVESRNPSEAGVPQLERWPSKSETAAGDDEICTIIFSPKLTYYPIPTVLFTQRLVCISRTMPDADPQVVVERTLWSRTFDSEPHAVSYSTWMSSEAHNWTYWGQFCLAFGPEPLFAVIDAEVTEFRNREFEKEEQRLVKAERQRELASVIDSYAIERDGQFGLTLQRGNAKKPFFAIMFRERWERERFRDWFRHQFRHFARYAELLDAGTSLELERHLLAEMLKAENEVKKAGLSAGGRRPLRFYRGDE